MAQFSGGYVGGGRSGPADLSALTNAINARNQRQDAAMLPNLQAYGPAGVALMAQQGDDAAARFMDRYYGKGKWDQYVPKVSTDPETGDPTILPPEGVPWDQTQRALFETDFFGMRNVEAPEEQGEVQDYTRERRGPEERERREGERPQRRRPDDVRPVVEEEGEEPPVDTDLRDDGEVTPEPTPPREDDAELTEGTGENPEILRNRNESRKPADWELLNAADAGGASRIGQQLINDALVEAQRLFPDDPTRQEAEVVRTIRDRVNTYVDDPRGLPNSIAWSAQMLGIPIPDQNAVPPPATGVPPADAEFLRRRNMGSPAVAPGASTLPNAEGTTAPPPRNPPPRADAAPSVFYDEFGRPINADGTPASGPQGAVPGGTTDFRVGADVSGRVDQMAGSMSIERGVDPATGSLREQVRVGNAAVPVRNQSQHVMAQHVVAGLEEPNSPRGRAGRAAMRAQARQNVPQIRETLRETSTMVPVGAFAARVDAFVRSDPAGASMYFKEMADSLIGAQSTMADTQYKGALSRQAEATARRTEMQAEAEATMSPQERASLLQAQARKANAEAAILEAQGNVAVERAQAEVDRLLADIDLTKEEREAISGRLALGWAELDLRERLGMMQGSAAASPFDLMLDIYKTTDDEDTKGEMERVMLEALGYDVSDPKWWQFWKGREISPGGGPPSPAEADAASGEADSFVDEYSVP